MIVRKGGKSLLVLMKRILMNILRLKKLIGLVEWALQIPMTILIENNFFDAINFPQYDGDSDFFFKSSR